MFSLRISRPLLVAFALAFAIGGAVKSVSAVAQGGAGDITVTPTRIMLEGRTRSATISLANTGARKATYRLAIVNMRMTENGGFERIEEGGGRPGEIGRAHV